MQVILLIERKRNNFWKKKQQKNQKQITTNYSSFWTVNRNTTTAIYIQFETKERHKVEAINQKRNKTKQKLTQRQ